MEEPKIIESYSEHVTSSPREKRRYTLALGLAGGAALLYLALMWALFFHKSAPSPNSAQQATAGSTTPAQITISSLGFVPQTTVIQKGTRVVWLNRDKIAHQVTLDLSRSTNNPPGFTPAHLSPGRSFSYIFKESGSFSYYDGLVPTGTKIQTLHGQVVVR